MRAQPKKVKETIKAIYCDIQPLFYTSIGDLKVRSVCLLQPNPFGRVKQEWRAWCSEVATMRYDYPCCDSSMAEIPFIAITRGFSPRIVPV